MPGYWKPFHVKVHECVLVTREDALTFSEELRKAFPRIRFVSDEYATKFFDVDAWHQAIDEAERNGRATPRRLDFTRDPTGAWPDYFPSLADVLETRFRVWIEPRNWRPRWRLRRRDDLLTLDNQPQLYFTFRRSNYSLPDPRRRDGLHGDPHLPTDNLESVPDLIDRKEPVLLEGHRMLGGWNKGDDVAKAFIHKVWRILDKMSTNRLVAVDRRTFMPIPPDGSAHPEPYVRASLDALVWARGPRHNYLAWGNHLYKPEMYFKWYRPSDEVDDDDAIAKPAKAARKRPVARSARPKATASRRVAGRRA